MKTERAEGDWAAAAARDGGCSPPQHAPAAGLYDAHNHLQDKRLAGVSDAIHDVAMREGIRRMVVNGSAESDWQEVLDVARRYPFVIPSFGYHPWYVAERSANWKETLCSFLDKVPSAVGEIGLDRWVRNPDCQAQEETFASQLAIAAERNVPASIHCLKAWGTLYRILEAGPRPRCGFVLHSFGGPKEMVKSLADLGAYFSLPGYFAHARKQKQRETFKLIPAERLLLETDAPDQALPDELVRYRCGIPSGDRPINHPGNLSAVYAFAADLYGETIEMLALRVERNFKTLFASFL